MQAMTTATARETIPNGQNPELNHDHVRNAIQTTATNATAHAIRGTSTNKPSARVGAPPIKRNARENSHNVARLSTDGNARAARTTT
jgi:hypothetical protein